VEKAEICLWVAASRNLEKVLSVTNAKKTQPKKIDLNIGAREKTRETPTFNRK